MANVTMYLQAATGDDPKTIDALQYTGVELRQLFAAMYHTEGIIKATDGKVGPRAAGANMSVDVPPLAAIVTGDQGTNPGSYFTAEDATTNVAVPAAPGSGTRTHLIVEQIYDKQADGGSLYGGKPICLEDTDGTGARLTDSALVLASVTVPAGAASVTASMINDLRPYACYPGRLLGWNTKSGNTGTSDSFVEVAVGTKVTINLAARSVIAIKYSLWGHTEGTDKANSAMNTLRIIAGPNAPGLGGTLIDAANGNFGASGADATVGDEMPYTVGPGQFTIGNGFMARGGSGHQDDSQSGLSHPARLIVRFEELA